MPRFVEFTPVIAPRGKIVHATTLETPTRTACGRRMIKGWRIALKRLNCDDCKLAVYLDCRPKEDK